MDDSTAILTIAVAHHDDRVEVSARGDVDMASVGLLRRALEGELADGAPHLVVDLSEVGFIDSMGLSALVAARRLAPTLGAEMSLARPSRRALAALRVSGLIDVFQVLDASDVDADIA